MKILYTDKFLTDKVISKTAHCLMRFCPYEIICVYDECYDKDSFIINVENGSFVKIPVVNTVSDLKNFLTSNNFSINQCEIVIAMAPVGGELINHQLETLKEMNKLGFKVLNPLHDKIDFAKNIRHEDTYRNYIAKDKLRECVKILFVGTDFSNGKMTSTVLANKELKTIGIDSDWLATGQTGVLIKGEGCIIDSLIIDFVPGNIERIINESSAQYILIEGQGSILHPAYSPSSFALFHTSKPEYFIVCHKMNSTKGHMDNNIPSLTDFCNIYSKLAENLGFRSKLLGVCIDSSEYSFDEYLIYKQQIERELEVNCVDPLRESLLPMLKKGLGLGLSI